MGWARSAPPHIRRLTVTSFPTGPCRHTSVVSRRAGGEFDDSTFRPGLPSRSRVPSGTGQRGRRGGRPSRPRPRCRRVQSVRTPFWRVEGWSRAGPAEPARHCPLVAAGRSRLGIDWVRVPLGAGGGGAVGGEELRPAVHPERKQGQWIAVRVQVIAARVLRQAQVVVRTTWAFPGLPVGIELTTYVLRAHR
jgi:hypothetical protein